MVRNGGGGVARPELSSKCSMLPAHCVSRVARGRTPDVISHNAVLCDAEHTGFWCFHPECGARERRTNNGPCVGPRRMQTLDYYTRTCEWNGFGERASASEQDISTYLNVNIQVPFVSSYSMPCDHNRDFFHPPHHPITPSLLPSQLCLVRPLPYINLLLFPHFYYFLRSLGVETPSSKLI